MRPLPRGLLCSLFFFFSRAIPTMADNGWVNADMLPGVKINTGANFRVVQLVQQGFVQIQP